MPKFTEKERRVITTRIQGAGQAEQGAIGAWRQAGLQGLGQAPTIAGIQQALTGRPRELDEMRRAIYGGISQGLGPQLQQALQMAAEQANARGLGRSTIDAALQGQTVAQIMGPALLQAQQQYGAAIPQLMGIGLQRAQGLAGLRGQAFSELGAALSRDLEERSRNTTQTQSMYQRQQSPWSRVLGAGLGMLSGGFLGGLGQNFAGSLFGGGGGQESMINAGWGNRGPSPYQGPGM